MSLPQELKALTHWVGHTNKRPHLPPDKWMNGASYEDVKSRTPVSDYTQGLGLLIAPHTEHDYIFIDIDFPGTEEEKHELMAILPPREEWGSQEHLDLIERSLAQIRTLSLGALTTQTYTEFSPSGTGLRMVISSADKRRFGKAYKKSKVFAGQISFRNQFVTFTEIPFPGSPSTVLEVPLLDLCDAFNFTPANSGDLPEVEATPRDFEPSESLPTASTIIAALHSIPIDQNERIKKLWQEITGDHYEHYDFWLKIGMALHNYSGHFKSASNIYKAFLTWSKQDEVAYTSEEDVHAKWKSFKAREEDTQKLRITWRTLLKLANRCTFDWPRPKLDKNGIQTGRPLTNEFVNLEYLLNFYNIKLYEDDGYYVSGEADICKRYFSTQGATEWFGKFYGPLSYQALCGAVLRLCQDSKWSGVSTVKNLVDVWVTLPRDNMDMFKMWLDTPYKELPDMLRRVKTKYGEHEASDFDKNSNIDYLFKCLNVQYTEPGEIAIAKAMLKKTLMQMIKFREDLVLPFTDNGGMLILIGAENTYKSTFFKLLLPRALEGLRKEVNMQIKGEKSVRDFIRYLGKKTIVQVDEFEGIMDQQSQSSLFKAIISGDNASMTDIYQTTDTQMPRKAIITGTSNEMKQILSDNGSRRMWFVKVNKIDTDAMLCINLHKLYNDLRAEFRDEYKRGKMPWLLGQEEINTLYKMNEQLASTSDLDMWLQDVWPIDEELDIEVYLRDIKSIQTDNSGKLWTTMQVIQVLGFRGMNTSRVKLPALERALERHCGRFTGTRNKTIASVKPKGAITNGKMCQGITSSGKPKYTRWILPPKTNDPV